MTHNDGKIMSSKYATVGLIILIGRITLSLRNFAKEDELYYNVLGLSDESEFVFINNLYNTDIRDSELLSSENYDLPVVEQRFMRDYSL